MSWYVGILSENLVEIKNETTVSFQAILSCRIRGVPPMNLYILHDRIATFKMKNKKRNLPCET